MRIKAINMRDLDFIGIPSVLVSVTLNTSGWLMQINWNQVFLIVTSIFGLIYLFMRIYHQYLVTKKFKKDNRVKKLF